MTAAIAAAVVVHAAAQGQGQLPSQFPLSLGLREKGSSLTGALEGWYHDKDGSVRVLVGYMNRNTKQEFDIPVGPNNHIDPGGPDQGQPTHFQPGRQWGVFSVKVPKDFGDKKLTWTLVANGQTMSVPMGLHRDYQVEPLKDPAEGNTPPVLKFEPQGPAFQGPPRQSAASLTTTSSNPLTLTIWATDDGKVDPSKRATDTPVTVTWTKFRGPGVVTFSNPKPPVDKTDGKTTTTATFSVPGEYVLRVQGNDVSGEGGGGFQCCWTNAHVRVTVTPGAVAR